MNDSLIIELYFSRSEDAVKRTREKYGSFIRKIAMNILSDIEDAKECENDVYFKAWDSIPPARPYNFRAWLGRVARNICLNTWNRNHATKRYSGLEVIFDELDECIPSPETVEKELEEKELADFINTWIRGLAGDDRRLFVRRYWAGISVKDLAHEIKSTPQKTAKRLYNIRRKLKISLENEGYSI